ncbi:methyl-accepting chemotaxis protein [Tepidibacter hydrothermalis]|uniref:Methyl-accepting chemotaxis protein n=1 Tax=Tepidibacter hydrothermalis TaxID=3036126 RepID=A0ABY8EGU8_9FIRM|nr:methyl-accepting chemotaxis protein [Tepidibacter hydrothermalis]WFD12171.1 methyl-accepting chemotaxis protein [Tepidibacter hydrothermalis]
MRLTIKNKVLILVLSVIIIPLTILGYQSYQKSTCVIEEQFKNSMLKLNKNVDREIRTSFNGYISSLNIISENMFIQSVDENYEYEAYCLELFEDCTNIYKEALSVYMGTENGKYITYPYDDGGSEGYDPRTRPWYKDAVKANKPIITDAYEDSVSGKLVMTYAIPVHKENNKLVGVVALDITLDELSKKVNSIKIGESGYSFIIDTNGNFITRTDKNNVGENINSNEFLTIINSKNEDIIDYDFEEKNGAIDKKIVAFKKMDDTDWMLVTFIDYGEIAQKGNYVYKSIIMVGIIIGLIACITGVIFSNRITKDIKHIVNTIDRVKDGDLRSKMNLKSNDEIGDIGRHFDLMIDNIKNLLMQSQNVGNRLSESSSELAAITEEVSASSEEISKSIQSISQGVKEQSIDVENGVELAVDLDNKFNELSDNMNKMLKDTDEVIGFNKVGIGSVQDLQNKTDLNNKSILKIENALNKLTGKSKNIGVILDTIRSIAEQTNLLALNASIEAARAGDAGKGFAVVADEIRKLAEGSGVATNEIQNIIDSIHEENRNTVMIMDEVKNISMDQTNSVQYVNKSFEDISNSIEHITSEINIVSEYVSNLSKNKDLIVESIKRISLVSEEGAASSEEISVSVEHQSKAVEQVAKSAQDLNELSIILEDSIKKFNI